MVQNTLRGPDWRKIQVSLEIAVEFVEFLNIDLADTGVYQIRAGLKCDGKVPHCIEVSSCPRKRSHGTTEQPANGSFSSSSYVQQEFLPSGNLFKVRHQQQRIKLQDVLLYRVFLLVNPLNIEESVTKTEFTLSLDIVHVERDGDETTKTSVGERTMKFFIKHGGLHFHRPVLFGYSNFCQLSLSVHGTLIALQEPYRRFQYEVRPSSTWKREAVPKVIDIVSHSSMNLIIFGTTEVYERAENLPELHAAKKRMVAMCRFLIAALEALQAKYIELQHMTDENYSLDVKSLMDCPLQLGLCTSEIEAAPDREALIETGQKLVTQMAGEIVRIWTNFVDAFLGCLTVSQYLMEVFREAQLRRLGEGVFLLDHHKSYLLAKHESGVILARHDNVWDLLKRSKYYTDLPALPVACLETDGRPCDIPCIFEDRYYHIEPEVRSEDGTSQPPPLTRLDPMLLNGAGHGDRFGGLKESDIANALNGIIASDENLKDSVKLKSVRRIDDASISSAPSLGSPSGSTNGSSLSLSTTANGTPSHTPLSSKRSSSPREVRSSGQLREHDRSWMKEECSLTEMLRGDPVVPYVASESGLKVETFLLADKTDEEVAFQCGKAAFKDRCLKVFNGLLFSDYPLPNATHSCAKLQCVRQSGKVHLIICVHGLEGTHEDMKLVRTYLERALPMHTIDFLMSHSVNGNTTYRNMEHLTETFVCEILDYLASLDKLPEKISFIGHSLGALLVRAAIAHPAMEPYHACLHSFLSFCGPHFGLINNPSKIVTTGLWIFLKWRKAESLTQLALRDDPDMRNSFIYKLSERDAMHHFHYILLVSSAQDHYAPYYSARLEPFPTSSSSSGRSDGRDSTVTLQNEMARNILEPISRNQKTKIIRYDIRVPTEGAGMPDNITGRLAHIAVIDSEIFLEKFMTVNVQYFV
ncbi:Protein FAM135A [Hypsibius exemplaris]|uniref:Protein FAM135A n=1 Tax=Hypsibius exemplaris TaxID=2072580 RepID=A0A1W0WWY7_HYPEX|nr:Protein FAM135A [Hypsibius exemplaris]